MRFCLSLCVLAAFACGAFAANKKDSHPPVGAVVVATDNGKSYKHVGNGHFVEVAQTQPACICGTGCVCPAGTCPSKCPVTSAPFTYLPPNPPALPQGYYAAPSCSSCQGGSCGLPQSYYFPAAPQSYYFGPQGGCPNGSCAFPPTIVK